MSINGNRVSEDATVFDEAEIVDSFIGSAAFIDKYT